MAPVLQIENLTKSYGVRMLFTDVTFTVQEGDKIGIVAKNGSGKSTMLKIIAGREDYDSGNIIFRNNLKVSILEQTPVFDDNDTLRQFIDRFSNDEDIRKNIIKYITQIGDGIDIDADFGTLSGGQKKRIAIAASIAIEPELLILDEPTNHLDIKTIEWLENYLSRSRISLILITHDRYFLERVCNRIIEIDRERIFTYPGNYAKYLEQRQHRIDVMSAELSKIKNILRKEQEWMSRQPQARAGKAQYRIDRFYDLKKRSHIDLVERNVDIHAESSYVGKKIFEARNVNKFFGDKCVLKDFSYNFARYEKIGIVGENGVGKSTFVKMLQGIINPDTGSFDVGQTVKFGYYSQDRHVFDGNKTVFDAINDIADDIELGGIRVNAMQYLQHFLFSPKDQQKYISTLSGGELSRLYLASVLMRRPNFLILDEPTNDLDIVTLGILEDYLINFKGCAIIISHDRYFLDNIVDHIFVMQGDGVVKDFPGNYSEYRRYIDNNDNPARERPSEKAVTTTKQRTERPARLTYKETIEFNRLSDEIAILNKEKNEIEQAFNSGNEIENIVLMSERYQQIKEELDEKEFRWLELSEKIS